MRIEISSVFLLIWSHVSGETEDHFCYDMAEKYAPLVHLNDEQNYPMDYVTYYWAIRDNNFSGIVTNADRTLITSKQIPVYYEIQECDGQLRIHYQFFYGYQSTCNLDCVGIGEGKDNTQQTVTVIVDDVITETIDAGVSIYPMLTGTDTQEMYLMFFCVGTAVVYSVHGKRYTRFEFHDGFNVVKHLLWEGRYAYIHPIVHSGQRTHSNYHTTGGMGEECNSCKHWEDRRSCCCPKAVWRTWNKVVTPLFDSYMSPGNQYILEPRFPSQPLCSITACELDPNTSYNECMHSQCLRGDNETSNRMNCTRPDGSEYSKEFVIPTSFA